MPANGGPIFAIMKHNKGHTSIFSTATGSSDRLAFEVYPMRDTPQMKQWSTVITHPPNEAVPPGPLSQL